MFTYLRKKTSKTWQYTKTFVVKTGFYNNYKSAYRSNIMIFTEIVARKYRLEVHFKSELFIEKTKQGSETWLKFPYWTTVSVEKSALKKAREISQTAQIICPFPQCPFHNWHFRTVFLQYSPTKTCSCVAWRLLKRAMVCVSQFHEFSPRFPTWTIADTFLPTQQSAIAAIWSTITHAWRF